jgi:hypothetical protein
LGALSQSAVGQLECTGSKELLKANRKFAVSRRINKKGRQIAGGPCALQKANLHLVVIMVAITVTASVITIPTVTITVDFSSVLPNLPFLILYLLVVFTCIMPITFSTLLITALS